MSASIFQFFINYSIVIYLFLLIGIIFAIRGAVKARLEMKDSIYGLERKIAQRHINRAVTAIALIMFIAVAEFILVVFLAPNFPALSMIGKPTLSLLTSPENTLSPETLATLGESTPKSTTTGKTSGCIPGQIMITSPKAGDVIKGKVILEGTANIPNFGFYQYEFAPSGSDNWNTIEANNKVINDSELGRWNTSEVIPGDYNVRLVVLDNQGNFLPPCIVPVRVTSP